MTPTINIHPDALELARLLEPSWPAHRARIRTLGHPTNESGGGGPAGGTAGPGGGTATAAQPGPGEQPAQGRGDVDHLAGLYDLSSAPETLRPHLQEELRKINAGVGRRFQEHAEFRQRFEPLADLDGLTDTPREDVEDLLAVREMIVQAVDENDPNDEQLYEWWNALGDRFGFFGNNGEQPGGEPAGDPEDAGAGGEADETSQQLQEQIAQLQQRLDGYERNQLVQTADQEIERELTALSDKHSLDEDAQKAVLQLAYAYPQVQIAEALNKGLADYFRISGKAEAGLVENAERSGTPGPTTPAGGQVPAPGADGPMRLGDKRLKQAAVARLQHQSTSGAAA